MKINFIIPFTNKTGGIKMIFEYANRLQEKGNDVLIYVPMLAYKFNNKGLIGSLKRIKASGSTIKRCNNVNWFDLKVPIKLVPTISDRYIRNANSILATAWPTAKDVYNLNNNKGNKYYFIQGYEIWSGKKEEVDQSYLLPLKQITIANWIKELMVGKFKRTDTQIVYNGIDFNEFNNKNKKFENHNKQIVCMMYSKSEFKGYKEGLEAFESVKSRLPELKLILFGMEKGENIPSYAEFHLNPSREELKSIYCKSDVFIFPSKFEGWGLTPLEAMACKCAVVGTNVGAINEIGVNGENVLISEPGDVEVLAQNLYEILNDIELMKKISINGYNTVINFSWDKSIEKFENILKKSDMKL